MLNIAVCDDVKDICEQLKEMICVYGSGSEETIHVDLFPNGEDLYERLSAGEYYDLIFLDIELPGLSGIEVGAYLREQGNETTQIVFISGNTHYAMELFALRPLDFLTKPLSREKVFSCLKYAVIRKEQGKELFSYHVSGVRKKIHAEDILYFQSFARKIHIKSKNGEDMFYGKLNEIESCLRKEVFVRIHQSVLVNCRWISTVCRSEVTMTDGKVFPVSYPRRKEAAARFRAILFENRY